MPLFLFKANLRKNQIVLPTTEGQRIVGKTANFSLLKDREESYSIGKSVCRLLNYQPIENNMHLFIFSYNFSSKQERRTRFLSVERANLNHRAA